MYWSSNFLAVVFRKREISQQVLFHNFHLIVFFGSNNQWRNRGIKVEILQPIWPLTCLLFARICTF